MLLNGVCEVCRRAGDAICSRTRPRSADRRLTNAGVPRLDLARPRAAVGSDGIPIVALLVRVELSVTTRVTAPVQADKNEHAECHPDPSLVSHEASPLVGSTKHGGC